MEPPRYTTPARVLHWAIALAVAAQFALGWWMQSIPKAPPGARADAFNLHKSLGLLVLALMVARVLWRARAGTPPWPAMPAWQEHLAKANHALLYLALLVLPITGYLGSAFSGYPVMFFGATLPAWGGAYPAGKAAMGVLHLATTWVLAGALVLHVAGALHHAVVERGGLFGRMGWGRG
jgi:cytochrome b561